MDDRLVVLQAEAPQHRVHALGAEDAHQVVLQRQEEFRAAGIALPARTAAQLVVDASAFVPLGADDVEAARLYRPALEIGDLGADFRLLALALLQRGGWIDLLANPHLDIAAELNVGAAAGHVGGNRDRAGNTRLGDDEGLLLVMPGVEDGEGARRLAGAGGRIERLQRVGRGKVDLLVAVLLEEGAQAAPISRSRWCRPASAAA